jgi:hypothetical protein
MVILQEHRVSSHGITYFQCHPEVSKLHRHPLRSEERHAGEYSCSLEDVFASLPPS